ncbi:3-dehydroquinate synthase [bacterium]
MNIVLTGYMGTGKTVIAQELNNILGWELIDTDELIVEQENRSINDIFENRGEEYFRDVESEIIQKVSGLDKKIISAGGGAVLRKENILNLKKNGMVVCLTAAVEEIFYRLQHDDTRPLLKVDNPLAKIKEMLKTRAPFYANNNYSIDTTGVGVKEIAKQIVSFMPDVIDVDLNANSYKIFVGKKYTEIVNWLPDVKGSKILIITDSNVYPLYSNDLKNKLEAKGYTVFSQIVPAGEEYKNLQQIHEIYKFCVEAGLDRASLIIALGGGVVGDMAGFAAATYLRGIKFIQAPTTLLAQVDASIGGKTGVDLATGKNLVGAFYQPLFVWIDPLLLHSLDEVEFKNGLAEVIKYGVIYSPTYWEFIKKNIEKILNKDEKTIKEMLYLCAKAKADIVSKDEKESGLRKILNFGHSLGHAIETFEHYKGLKHGQAVGLGMVFAAYLGFRLGKCDKKIEKEIQKLLENIGFEIKTWKKRFKTGVYDIDEIINIMAKDKKMGGGRIDFILPIDFGKVEIVSLDLEYIKQILGDWGN